jgi:hypothetical protein
MRIWKFISAKLPNNKHLEVFISLNYQKRKNKKQQKPSRRKPRFAAL